MHRLQLSKYKSLVLPIALIGGFFFRSICVYASVTIPYIIFAILILTFSGVKLSTLRPSRLDIFLALFQIIVSMSGYVFTYKLTNNEILATGVLMCVLCPVASSVTVVATMLGANPVRTTTYTIIGNLVVAMFAPLYITFLHHSDGTEFLQTLTMIFYKIASVIAVPFFVILFVQKFLPLMNNHLAEFRQYSFYLWAYALLVTIGQTADFVVRNWEKDSATVFLLMAVSLIICILQFICGRLLGRLNGDKIAGGQLLGQKNSAMGIWITNTFLNPVASVALASYSIWQNLFNSYQLFQSNHREKR